MSVTIAEKGSVEKRVTLVKRGRGKIQHVMLDEIFIQKAKNYHLQCGRYITNAIPAILQTELGPLISIMPRYSINVAVDGANQLDGWEDTPDGLLFQEIYQFEPRTAYSSAGFCEQISHYVRDFNHHLNAFGSDHSTPPFADLTRTILAGDFIDQNDHILPFDTPNHMPAEDIIQYISIGFDSSGHMGINLSFKFLCNFYIELNPIFAKRIGLPVLIYNDGDTMSNQPGIADLFGGNVFTIDSGLGVVPTYPTTIYSTKSIFDYDDRLSIDVEISLPIAQTIDVLDGKEKHTFLLSRFIITDYKQLDTRTQQRSGVILSKAIFEDKLALGMHELTQGNPEAHTTRLLPGQIQELDCRMILRYKSYSITDDRLVYKIDSRVMEMKDHELYELLLQFNKRV